MARNALLTPAKIPIIFLGLVVLAMGLEAINMSVIEVGATVGALVLTAVGLMMVVTYQKARSPSLNLAGLIGGAVVLGIGIETLIGMNILSGLLLPYGGMIYPVVAGLFLWKFVLPKVR